ncbi:MAG: hypothetical protein BZ138_03335 [Methanosphaera sp. rholeuAM270]|nr:MAG: hypothetical protein BZ138_03335 [Methanosphaera sp. rholeuAM270]
MINDNKNPKNNERLIDWKEIGKNYLILLIGLFIMSFGVALSVKSDLGTTPISSIPNVLKYAIPLSLGMITIIFNFLLIVIQVIILKSDFDRKQWMQIVVTIIFGYFIDFALYILAPIEVTDYNSQWILCIISCFIIALGVYFEVTSKAIVLPGEGVSLALRHVTHIEFGKLKTAFDTSNVIIAALISILLYDSFRGIGLGTIFAGIVVGYIVRFYKKLFEK